VIQFKIIRWKNLLASGNVFTEFKLNTDSSTLIIGENGSGKSTILDALTFGLFGRPFRSINKNQLINSINQGGTEVEIEFNIGSKEYIVKRGISKNFFIIYQDGKLLNQDASVRDYQEFLEKTILKLNYKSFTQIVILGSSSFIPFMRLRASDRRAIIEDLLDIEIFSVMNQLLRGRFAQNKENIGTVDVALGLSTGERKHLEFLINKLKEDKSVQINKNEKDINEHEKFLKNYKKDIDDFVDKNKTLSESISDQKKVREKVNTLSDYARGIEKNIMKFEDEIEFYENNETCGVCRQNIPENFRKGMIEDFHAKMHKSGQAILKLGFDKREQTERIKEIDDVLDIMKEHDTEATRAKNSLEACVQYIEKVTKQNKELLQMTEDIDQKKKDLDILKDDIDIYNKEKEDLSTQKHLYETAATLLKDSGIKTRIIKQYLPIINKLINVHLGKLDFYVSFELDESFNETIRSRYRDEFTYDSFSEGEKMRIDLALLFTWRAVAKLKNSVNTNLLVLDEVFDSSLDAAGTDEFLKILNDLAGDVNTFVISHKGEILFDKFNKVIKFEKHKNFSRIVS
jgi:DNA repair exonuclease SbcCD ATPase subunit